MTRGPGCRAPPLDYSNEGARSCLRSVYHRAIPLPPNNVSPFDEALWSAATEGSRLPALGDLVEEMLLPEREHQLTCATVIADGGHPAESLAAASGGAAVVGSAGAVGVLRIAADPRPYSVAVWPTADDGVFHLVGTVPVTDERWRRVERWLASAGPSVGSVFLDQADFDGMEAALQDYGRPEVSRLTARMLRDGSSFSRGWAAGERGPRPTYRQAVVETQGIASVRTLTIHVGTRLSLHLRRRAGATFYGGEFPIFERVVLDGLARAGARRKALLSGRERHGSDRPDVAVAVKMASPIFDAAESIADLIATLSSQKGVGVAILHRNPYLHVGVTDYRDGSSFDAVVTDTSCVKIFPGHRATTGALSRLTDQLAEHFAAVEVTTVPAARRPTRDDLFTTG